MARQYSMSTGSRAPSRASCRRRRAARTIALLHEVHHELEQGADDPLAIAGGARGAQGLARQRLPLHEIDRAEQTPVAARACGCERHRIAGGTGEVERLGAEGGVSCRVAAGEAFERQLRQHPGPERGVPVSHPSPRRFQQPDVVGIGAEAQRELPSTELKRSTREQVRRVETYGDVGGRRHVTARAAALSPARARAFACASSSSARFRASTGGASSSACSACS